MVQRVQFGVGVAIGIVIVSHLSISEIIDRIIFIDRIQKSIGRYDKLSYWGKRYGH